MQDKIAIVLPVRHFGTERYKRLTRCLDSYLKYTDGLSDVFVLHDNDECALYDSILQNYPTVKNICVEAGITLMQKINIPAMEIANKYKYMGFIGDDIVFRTKWEQTFIDQMSSERFVLAFANDLMYTDGSLATHPFVTTNMVRAVGFFGCPAVSHHYFDNYWMDLVRTVGSVKFLETVIMEHFHLAMGKDVSDVGYEKIDSQFRESYNGFNSYKANGNFDEDVRKVLAYVE